MSGRGFSGGFDRCLAVGEKKRANGKGKFLRVMVYASGGSEVFNRGNS